MKPMLDNETGARIPGVSFAAEEAEGASAQRARGETCKKCSKNAVAAVGTIYSKKVTQSTHFLSVPGIEKE